MEMKTSHSGSYKIETNQQNLIKQNENRNFHRIVSKKEMH